LQIDLNTIPYVYAPRHWSFCNFFMQFQFPYGELCVEKFYRSIIAFCWNFNFNWKLEFLLKN
jgi:hypothetical protein